MEPGEQVADGCQLLERMASGDFGEVWRAEAPGGVEVAVRVIFRTLDPDETRRESECLELVKKLRHRFLIQMQAFRQLGDRLLVFMELADGSLRDRLQECKQQGLPAIPEAELLGYFREAAEAIDYLHGRSVLHRAIKPVNILSLERHVKLADFGLARVYEQAAHGAGDPCRGMAPYMAPELWRGKASPHSDQYALAVSYSELKLDRPVFTGPDLGAIMSAHLQPRPDLQGLLPAEQQVLRKALDKDPARRFPSCSAFVRALGGMPLSDVLVAAPQSRGPAHYFRYEAAGWGQLIAEWRDGVLTIGQVSRRPTEVRPTVEQWRRFWDAAEIAWNLGWQGDYGSGIMCGSPWVLTMRRGGQEVSCSGNGADAAPAGFIAFHDALMALAQE